MASQNFFALLGDDENDDPSDLLARAVAAPSPKASPPDKPNTSLAKKQPQQQRPPPTAKLPSRPIPPAQAVKEAQADGGRGRGNRGGRGGGRGSFGNREFGNRDRSFDGAFNRPSREGGFQGDRGENNDRSFNSQRDGGDFQGSRGGYVGSGSALNGYVNSPGEDAEGGRESSGSRGRGRGRARGGRGLGFLADGDERPRRREYDRRSGTGRGNELKRDGAGLGNWGIETDLDAVQETVEPNLTEVEKAAVSDIAEKKPEEQQPEPLDAAEKKDEEEEDNEMTLDEYEKIKAEKRRALEASKAKERKVALDKDFESMQIVDKKIDEDVFLKLGCDKDKGKRKEVLDKEERARKCVSINEFLKPAEGEEYYSPTGRRGRGGRGRGERGGARGVFGGGYGNSRQDFLAPRIEDPGQFPTLGGM